VIGEVHHRGIADRCESRAILRPSKTLTGSPLVGGRKQFKRQRCLNQTLSATVFFVAGSMTNPKFSYEDPHAKVQLTRVF
jgi:hypothetical protein